MVRKAMVYLGLSDDNYHDYDAYEDVPPSAPPRRPISEQADPVGAGAVSAVRPMPRDLPADPSNGVTLRPIVRPITPQQNAKVQVVAPTHFSDAQEIGDRFKNVQPVIVNLQAADRELSRRMIDFCSGVTYALGGSMDKVADQVFLLTPTSVEISPDEKRRLQERGLYRS
ncbi:MAG: cell division protein SepF [Actinomycetota bacterium]|nr:cell division protein SepF [Actinomycetota bacterium]